MQSFPYLIIGGGMAADAAVKGIREIDADSPIAVIGAEPDPPYKRPPLTKKLWLGKPVDSIWLHTEDSGIDFMPNRRVVSIAPQNKLVTDDQGNNYSFGKLLIATGATPRRMPIESDAIIYYRTFQDYRRLRELTETGERFAVIGGGFIGSEIAASLTMNGKHVVMLFPEDTIGAKIYPSDLARYVTDFYRRQSVEVRSGETVTGVVSANGRHTLTTSLGSKIEVDGIVAGIGVEPNTALASSAGLPIDNGIAVDEFLNAGHPDIYAAGDVASFQSEALGRRVRVEHEDNAVTMGGWAGRAMAGDARPYTHLPYFYSDMFELGYEAVGDTSSKLETYADWQEQFRKGVVYYLQDGRVRGALLWNVWDMVPAARELISQPGPHTPESLKGRIA